MLEINSEQQANNIKQRKGRRKNGAHELLVHTGVSLPLSVRKEIESLVTMRNSTLAEVVRQLVIRGLAAYHRDGLLQEPGSTRVELIED